MSYPIELYKQNLFSRDRKLLRTLGVLLLAAILTSCAQGTNDALIVPRRPATKDLVLISNVDLTGTSAYSPQSSSRVLSIHTAGGNSQRTKSTSASFQMTSGIGID